MLPLTLAHANLIVGAALAEGRRQNLVPLAVAVLDSGGNLIAFQREDGAGFARYYVAYGKAWGALGMGFGTRELTERAGKVPTFVAALATATQGRMIPSPGGVLVVDPEGQVIGAVGISGDTGPNDESCAIAGIVAAGFRAVPGMMDAG
ncbi:MAG TPA: heme-binding protein [Anaerolineales bacterium]|nr:heme-binding protein [Anaerolineales bacterium]